MFAPGKRGTFDTVSQASRPSRPSSRGSTVFSLTDDLSRTELRQNLDLHFRPVFQKFVYGGEKIANHDLRRLLGEERYRSLLPPDKVAELLDLVDFNPGKAIAYDEFVKIVMGTAEFDSSYSRLEEGQGIARRLLNPGRRGEKTAWNVVCRNTVQNKELHDYLDKYNWCPPPVFILLITLAQIITFIYYSTVVPVSALQGAPMNSSLIFKPTRRQEVWRFITYCLLHQGVIDLLFNVVIQLLFGFPLEVVFKFWRVIVVYCCGILAGSLAQSVCDRYVGLAGCAGGAHAILAGHLIGLIFNWKELNNDEDDSRCRKITCSVPLRMLVMLLLVAPQVGLAVYRRYWFPAGIQIGFAAHIAGLVTGLLLGSSFLRDCKLPPWQTGTGWLNLFVFVAFVGGCIVFNIAYRQGYPPAEYY